MPDNLNAILLVPGLMAGIAVLVAVIWLVRRRNRTDLVAPEEYPDAPEADPAREDDAVTDNLLAIALVPVQLRVEAGRVQVDYRLALDNCADQPLVSLRAHIALATVGGEQDVERLADKLSDPVSDPAPLHVARLDPGDTHQQTGTLSLPLGTGDDAPETPTVAVVRLRVLAANLVPQTSAWVIGKARHQPGARIAAIAPIDLAQGRSTHELLLARQIAEA